MTADIVLILRMRCWESTFCLLWKRRKFVKKSLVKDQSWPYRNCKNIWAVTGATKSKNSSGEDPNVNMVLKNKSQAVKHRAFMTIQKKCFRCRYENFYKIRCPAIGQLCNLCQKPDHFANMCITKIQLYYHKHVYLKLKNITKRRRKWIWYKKYHQM